MNRLAVKLAAAAIVLFAPAASFGSEIWVKEVLQPFDLPDGIAVSRMTYVGYYDALSAVEMTCWPNRTLDPDRKAVANLNAASRAGLSVSVVARGRGLSDTIRVVLNASSLFRYRSPNGYRDTTLLAATVHCIVVNASQWSNVKFVEVRVKEPRSYARYGGMFRAAQFRCGPTQRQFTDLPTHLHPHAHRRRRLEGERPSVVRIG